MDQQQPRATRPTAELVPFPEMDAWVAAGNEEETFPAETVAYASDTCPELVSMIKAAKEDTRGFADFKWDSHVVQ
jgi:hypothetical protein